MESLAKLFGSPARLKTLRLFVFNQSASFTYNEVAQRVKLSKEVTHHEINELCKSGLLRKKNTRVPFSFQVNPRFEYLAALTIFVRETMNVRPRVITGALRRAGTLQLVVLSGFFTGVLESQIDLLVVGDRLDERALAQSVHSLEAELGREIRYASFTIADFRYRIGVYDRLFRDVFDYPHRLLIDKIGL